MMNFFLGCLRFVMLWSTFGKSASNILLHLPTITPEETILNAEPISPVHIPPIRVSVVPFVPYIHQDSKGYFYDGIEFEFLQTMAKKLNMSLQFETTSNRTDTCDDVAMGASDICIGGIFPKENSTEYALMSVTYASDDLTWCVRKAGFMPMYLAYMHVATPESWLLVIFAYGYTCGLLMYLLIQFDLEYEQRNVRDWHYTLFLVVLPAVLGMSPNFRPVKNITRVFFAFVLITGFFIFQIIFTRAYELLHKQVPWHQISSFNEIIDKDFQLVGSPETLNVLVKSNKISNRKIESFHICNDTSECLAELLRHEKIAIGGSRENILSSPFYSHSQVFCFEGSENIVSYPVALYMRRDFYLKEKVNAIIERLLEGGFFGKWTRDSQQKRKYDPPYTIPLQLPVSHISAALVFCIGCGSLISTLTFILEIFVCWKMKQKNRHKNWIHLEHFLDGKRHYAKNLPERLERQNKHSHDLFLYLE